MSRIRTRARKVDGGFVLNGQKIFITNAGLAHSLLVVADAMDGEERLGLTMFADARRFARPFLRPSGATMGWRASTNAEVFIDDLFVPDDDVIGEVGTGFAGAVRTFELSRIEVAACSIGVARAALEYARDYANERQAFGRPIARFQGVSFRSPTPSHVCTPPACSHGTRHAPPIAASRSAPRRRWPSCSPRRLP